VIPSLIIVTSFNFTLVNCAYTSYEHTCLFLGRRFYVLYEYFLNYPWEYFDSTFDEFDSSTFQESHLSHSTRMFCISVLQFRSVRKCIGYLGMAVAFYFHALCSSSRNFHFLHHWQQFTSTIYKSSSIPSRECVLYYSLPNAGRQKDYNVESRFVYYSSVSCMIHKFQPLEK